MSESPFYLAIGAILAAVLSFFIFSTILAPMAIVLSCVAIILGIRCESALIIGVGVLAFVIAKMALVFATDLASFIGLG